MMQDLLLHTGHAYGSKFNDPEWQRIAYSTEGFTAATATRGPARHALSQNPSNIFRVLVGCLVCGI